MDQDAHSPISVLPQTLRNVKLRFFLGPNSLNILKCAEEVMDLHQVILHQLDYRFDIYGRPKDIADALKESLLVSDKFKLSSPQQEERPLSSQVHHYSDSDKIATSISQNPKETTGEKLEQYSSNTPHSESDETYGDISVGFNNMVFNNSSPNDPYDTSQPLPVLPLYSSSKIDRKPPLPLRQRKTDYELAMDKKEQKLSANKSSNSNTNSGATERWSLVMVLCMNEVIAHYLLHRSGGFTSYLAGHQDLELCVRQGVTKEELKAFAQSSGLSIAISRERLPGSNEIPVWLQVWDMNALEDIITGITTDLASDLLYRKEVCWASTSDLKQRSEWDLKLRKFKGPKKEEDDVEEWLTHRNEKRPEDNGRTRAGVGSNSIDEANPKDRSEDNIADNDGAKSGANKKDKGHSADNWGFKEHNQGHNGARNNSNYSQGTDQSDGWQPRNLLGDEAYLSEWNTQIPSCMPEFGRKIPQGAGSKTQNTFTNTTSQSISSFFDDENEPPPSIRNPQTHQNQTLPPVRSHQQLDRYVRGVHGQQRPQSYRSKEARPFNENESNYFNRSPEKYNRRDRGSDYGIRPQSAFVPRANNIDMGWRSEADEKEVLMVGEWASPGTMEEVRKWQESRISMRSFYPPLRNQGMAQQKPQAQEWSKVLR